MVQDSEVGQPGASGVKWTELFGWRHESLGRQITADDLGCDGPSRDLVPGELDAVLTQFRRLGTIGRESAIRTYYQRIDRSTVPELLEKVQALLEPRIAALRAADRQEDAERLEHYLQGILRTYREEEFRLQSGGTKTTECVHLSMTANICGCPPDCPCQPCALPRTSSPPINTVPGYEELVNYLSSKVQPHEVPTGPIFAHITPDNILRLALAVLRHREVPPEVYLRLRDGRAP